MWQDVVDLKDFYDREIGHTARHLLRLRIRALWPDLKGQRLLGMGYAIPYLRQFLGEAERIGAVMPAAQGVMPWPRDGAGMTVLSDETELPFPTTPSTACCWCTPSNRASIPATCCAKSGACWRGAGA
jgi:hypothetical protein